MRANLRRFLSAGILLTWGVTFCFLYFSGKAGKILLPSFAFFALLAGVALVLMGVGRLLASKRVEAVDCAHGLIDGGLLRQVACTVILVAPLLIAAKYAPTGFDATAVQNRGLVDTVQNLPAASAQSNPYVPKEADGNIKAQTVDLLYAAEEPSMREDFENKEVELVGQYMPATTNNASGDRFKLVSMYMVCCAADARPVAVTVQMAKNNTIPEMSWVRVTGKATFPVEGGRRIPLVVSDSVKPCDPPESSFIN